MNRPYEGVATIDMFFEMPRIMQKTTGSHDAICRPLWDDLFHHHLLLSAYGGLNSAITSLPLS
jgi:hypothetical protein